jgi:hypothetical protein
MPVNTVVDTNVVLVANEQHPTASPNCIKECSLRLQEIMRQGRLVLDDNFQILKEYLKKTHHKTGTRPGDAFVKWALQNRCKIQKCDQVQLQENAERGFTSFPDDPSLNDFDPEDRIFVAVAAVHVSHPIILEAADCKWLDWAPILKKYDVEVEFVCKKDIKLFHQHKFGKHRYRTKK